MAMMIVAVLAFGAFFFLRKQQSSSDVTAAATQPSQTVVQPQTTIIQTPYIVPYFGPAIFIDDDPDFGFFENPCHFWFGARYDPDNRRCYYPFHRDCADRGLVWDADHDSCIRPPTRNIRVDEPVNVNITIKETATKGGTISNTINTTPSSTWSFKLQNGKVIDPKTVITFTSNCHSALGKNDASCGQVRTMCQSGTAANKDVCTALQDAGFK